MQRGNEIGDIGEWSKRVVSVVDAAMFQRSLEMTFNQIVSAGAVIMLFWPTGELAVSSSINVFQEYPYQSWAGTAVVAYEEFVFYPQFLVNIME